MRGLDVPEPEADFTADPVELFFDLVFVFAFAELVGLLIEHPTGTGVGEAALLFFLLWLPWTQFTWSANAVSGNTRPARTIVLIAAIASVPMAAAVPTAFEAGGTVFAVSLSIILLLGLAMIASGLEPGTSHFASAVAYAIPNVIAVVVIIVGSFLDDEARVVAWILGLLIVLAGTIGAGSGDWIVRSGHFAERHGLILIVALGEVIVAIGIPVVASLEEGEGLPAPTVWALSAAGMFAALLFWGYFDRPERAFEYGAEQVEPRDRGRYARDVYTYSHAPIVAGVIAAAAALEEITLHPKDPLADEFRWLLFAGLAMYLGGVVAGIARAFGVVARERLVCVVAIAVVLAVAGSWDGVVLLIVIDAVIALTLIAEHVRVERTFGRDREDAPA